MAEKLDPTVMTFTDGTDYASALALEIIAFIDDHMARTLTQPDAALAYRANVRVGHLYASRHHVEHAALLRARELQNDR